VTKFITLIFALVLSLPAHSEDQQSSTPLEQRIETYFQGYLNHYKQQVFERYHHLGGKATAVTVTDAKVTQWQNGTDTEQPKDIVQFTVDFTIQWSSVLHPNGDGHTDARNTYQLTNGGWTISRKIINTNGHLGNIDTTDQDIGTVGKLLLYLK
jgi:hypothetical protein